MTHANKETNQFFYFVLPLFACLGEGLSV